MQRDSRAEGQPCRGRGTAARRDSRAEEHRQRHSRAEGQPCRGTAVQRDRALRSSPRTLRPGAASPSGARRPSGAGRRSAASGSRSSPRTSAQYSVIEVDKPPQSVVWEGRKLGDLSFATPPPPCSLNSLRNAGGSADRPEILVFFAYYQY